MSSVALDLGGLQEGAGSQPPCLHPIASTERTLILPEGVEHGYGWFFRERGCGGRIQTRRHPFFKLLRKLVRVRAELVCCEL